MKFIGQKKIILIIAGTILVLFIGIAIGSGSKNNQPDLSQIESQNSSITDIPIQNKNNAGLVKVTRVVDGDTIEIEGGERIRYIGIDTPETVDPRKPIQCFGVEASNKNKELVEGKEIRLEKDITDRDKYNRLLRYVWIDDTFINLELVKQGFAYSYSYPPDIKYQDQFVKAQQEAREAKRGLWNACPITTEQEQSVSPTEQKENTPSGSCVIKGNINTSGEKIYHLPGCGSYEKTKIDESRGEKWFCTESEAQAAGWRKALNCP
jgi:micrococcal nuclease